MASKYGKATAAALEALATAEGKGRTFSNPRVGESSAASAPASTGGQYGQATQAALDALATVEGNGSTFSTTKQTAATSKGHGVSTVLPTIEGLEQEYAREGVTVTPQEIIEELNRRKKNLLDYKTAQAQGQTPQEVFGLSHSDALRQAGEQKQKRMQEIQGELTALEGDNSLSAGQKMQILKQELETLRTTSDAEYRMQALSADMDKKRQEKLRGELADGKEHTAGYLAASYVGGLTDYTSGYAEAFDAALPGKTAPWVNQSRRLKENLEGVTNAYAETVSENTQKYGGTVARGIGYSTPGMVLSMVTGGAGAGGLLKNPAFWASAVPMYGSGYADARAEGASEWQAQAFAILNGFAGAAVEVGGGIETIPASKPGIKTWLAGMVDEGKEEVIQGVIEQLAKKVVYDHEREWTSLTNPDAILNPSRAEEEFMGGALVGGVLGGVQTAAGSVAEAVTYIQQGEPYTQSAEKTREAIDIGLSAPKGTDARAAAEKLQRQVEKGKSPNAYTLGRMLYESGTPETVQARTIERKVLDSAAEHGVNEKTAEAVSAVAVRTGRMVTFVSPEALQTAGETGGQYSIRTTPDGTVYVQADESVIPQGATDKDIAAILSDIIKTKFNNMIKVNGQSIGINKITNNEWRWSRNAQHLMQDNEVYTDKMEILNNADEVLQAARSWTNENPKHNSSRGFIDFGRGKITFKVEKRGYTADVVVGIKNGGAAYLYDIVNIKSTKINDTSNADDIGTNADTPRRQDVSLDTTIPQNGAGVNTQSMQNGENYVSQAYGRYTADGTVELAASITTEEAMEFVLKHELTHAIEGSDAYGKLKRLVRQQMGEDAYTAAIERERENRRRQGDRPGADDPEAEVVADWIGKNLYRDGFARLIRNMDHGAAVRFQAILDGFRRTLGFTKNHRQAAVLRAAERAFAKALDSDAGGSASVGEERYDMTIPFAEQVSQSINRALNPRNAIYVGETSDILQQVGLNELPMLYAQRHLADAIKSKAEGGHGLTVDDILAMPEIVQHPALVMDSLTRDDSIVLVSDRLDGDGNPIIMAVKANGTGTYELEQVSSNFITSYYGKDSNFTGFIERAIATDKVLYIDKKKSQALYRQAGLQLPYGFQRLGYDTIIHTSNNVVNTQSMQNFEKNSVGGKKSYLPQDIQERENAAAEQAEKAENARRLGKSEGTVTETDSDATDGKGTTKLQRAQTEAFRRALELYDAGELSAAELEDTVAQQRLEAAADTDKKWRTGNRGGAQQKEATREFRREVRQEYAEKAADKQERAAVRETKTRIGKVKDSLEGLLKSPDRSRHIPTELAQPVRELLDLLRESPADIREQIRIKEAEIRHTPDGRKIERLKKEIQGRKQALEKALRREETLYGPLGKIQNQYKLVFSEEANLFRDKVEVLANQLGDRRISELSSQELDVVAEILDSVVKQIQNANTLHSEALTRGAVETGQQLIKEINSLPEKAQNRLTEGIRNYTQAHLDPHRFFEYLCGWSKDSVGAKISEAITQAQRKEIQIRRTVQEHFDAVFQQKEYRRLQSTRADDIVELRTLAETEQGIQPLRVTRGLMLSLYETLSCPGNRAAILDGGFILPDIGRYYGGRVKDAYTSDKAQRLTPAGISEKLAATLEAIRQTEDKQELQRLYSEYEQQIVFANQSLDQLKEEIEGRLTPFDRELLKAERDYFDRISKKEINETTEKMWNYEAARVKQYFPLYRDANFVNASMESLVADRTLENLGSLKHRVKNKAPVHIDDITQILRRSIDSTAHFCGWAPFQRDLNRILNIKSNDNLFSVKQTIARRYGSEGHTGGIGVSGMKYIENWMADISGARSGGSGFLRFFRKNAIRATLTANLRSALSQLGAIATAGAEMGTKYIRNAILHIPQVTGDALNGHQLEEEIAQYSDYFWQRTKGEGGSEDFALANSGENPIDKAWRHVDEKTRGYLLNQCQVMDTFAVKVLWTGCLDQVRDTRPGLSETEAKKAAGELLDRVIQRTQQNYTVGERCDLFRNPSELMKAFTTFRSDAVQLFNIIAEANGRFRAARRSGNAGEIQQTKSRLGTALAWSFTSILTTAVLRLIADAFLHRMDGRRDEDGALTAESIVQSLGAEMISSTCGILTFGDEIYSVLAARIAGERYYGLSDMGLENLGDLLQLLATGTLTAGSTMYNLEKVAKALGIPWRNIRVLTESFIYHAQDIRNGEFLSFEAGSDVAASGYYSQLYKATKSGKTAKKNALLQKLRDAGKTDAQIQAGLRTAARQDEAFVRREKELLRQVAESRFYQMLTEKEQKKAERGISGYIADEILAANTGGSLTKAHRQVQKLTETKGISVVAYYTGEAAKNGETADANADGTVSRQEYRAMLSKTEYDQITQAVLLAQKKQ